MQKFSEKIKLAPLYNNGSLSRQQLLGRQQLLTGFDPWPLLPPYSSAVAEQVSSYRKFPFIYKELCYR
jgi:hypothetical protein